MLLRSLGRGTLAVVLMLVVGAGAAGAAQAATLANVGGTLTYTGSDAADNGVIFNEGPAGTLRVIRNSMDGDPITDPAPGCTTITAGTEYECAGVTRLVASGGGGDDELNASGLTTVAATLNGGAGTDDLISGGGGDGLDGGPGDDFLSPGEGDDTADGGDGQDTLVDDEGNDRFAGGAGDDTFFGGLGNDDYAGGSGNDTAVGSPDDPPGAIGVSLNDIADDRLSGTDGEADNVRGDIEAVDTETRFFGTAINESANDTLTGNAGANTLSAGEGNDAIDGGTGNDVLNGGNGDDTITARDGFADVVNCGPGNDTAIVDTLDRVEDCENIQRADAGNANDVPEDRPPTVAFTAPGPGALLQTRTPTELTATATDDRGVANVLFIDDERIVCADATAPYTCAYTPRGEDVGRNTLAVVAVDTAQQTASAFRAVSVDRFAPAGITGAVTPARDRRAPFRFRTTGRLRLPAGVTPALGCAEGQVSIQVKAGAKTISTRRANLSRTCTFSSTVSFRDRRRFTRAGRLRFTLRFTGNEVLTRSVAVARNVRTR